MFRRLWIVLLVLAAASSPISLRAQSASDTAAISDTITSSSVDGLQLRLDDLVSRVDRQIAISTDSIARELQQQREALSAVVRDTRKALGGQNPEQIRGAIESLEVQLRLREDENAHLQAAVSRLVDEIEWMSEEHVSDAALAMRADSLAAVADRAARELELWTIGELYGHVRAWADLGLTLRAISLTAQNLLLFPESGSSGFDKTMKTLGAVGTLVGALVATSDASAGATTSGLSVLAIQVPSWFGGDRQSMLMESVARNRAFTDDVLAFGRIAEPFAASARVLQAELPTPDEARLSGLPKEPLAKYFGLISQRRDLSVVIRQMRARAEYLLSLDSLTERGQRSLNELLSSYDLALAQWESSEESYTATYQYLMVRANERMTDSSR